MDIKETKEGVVGVFAIAKLVAAKLKDGFQVSDLSAILDALKDDEDFKAKLSAAYEDAAKIPAELKDLSLFEMVELSSLLIKEGVALLEVFKSDAA